MLFNTEAEFEKAVIDTLVQYGWEKEVIYYPTEEELIQNWADILFQNNRSIDKLNDVPLTRTEMDQILEQITALQSPMRLNGFINGRSVSIKRDNPDDKLHLGKEVSLKIYDRQEIALGDSRYQIVCQPKFKAKSSILNDRRGDLMLLINGMPVIHLELKRSGIEVSQAYNQIEKYSHEGIFRGLFSLVQIFVAMQPEETVYFANPGEGKFNQDFYFHWENFNNKPIKNWADVIANLLNIPMAHQLIGFYTVADSSDGILKVMRSYQYFAANGIAEKVAKNNWSEGNQLGGHIWHTTGSGKTMTSFKSAQLIASSNDADKVIFLVDRKELATQSLSEYRAFKNDDESVQATENTNVLISKLKSNDYDNTLIVTSIQKLSNISADSEALNAADVESIAKKRLVIIVDECHRSTFGEMLATIKKTFRKALMFGFTGTPIQEVNIKKDSTTPTIFGDEIHRYTLSDGIRDGNVLGFDPYMVKVYPDEDVRMQVALHEAKAESLADAMADKKKKEVFLKFMDSSKVGMCGKSINNKWVKGIEDYVPNAQYETEAYRRDVIADIKKKWPLYSNDNKFHAIFATSSIPEAVAYYRLMKSEMAELNITAMFDPTIDNNGQTSLDKEDGIVEMLEDYNAKYDMSFTIPTYDKFRKDVSTRLAHKEPYENINRDEQIDILIVVNQMLTGFDSKRVNTLYLDKVLEYENLIQAISRTNRVYNRKEKPFGIIKWYRRPNTMERNLNEAIKAYSGDVPQGLFVDKLPANIRNMNNGFENIRDLFENAGVENFEKLPEDGRVKAKFAKEFNAFSRYLDAALIQGFEWSVKEYKDKTEGSTVSVIFTEEDYLKLLARYHELPKADPGDGIDDVPFDIDTRIIEHDSEKIDKDYMNSRFEKYIKLLAEDVSPKEVEKLRKELHSSFSMLSQERQKLAGILLYDIQSGNIELNPNKTFNDYINEMLGKLENSKIKRVVKNLGCSEELLRELFRKGVTETNISEYGVFDELKESCDREKSRKFFEAAHGESYSDSYLSMYIDEYLRYFLLHDGEDQFVEIDYEEALNEEYKTKEYKQIDVALTEEDIKDTKIVTTVPTAQLSSWYKEGGALASIIESDAFAYVDDHLCLNKDTYLEKKASGVLALTDYAKEHGEECFLKFITDEDGKLKYVTLPSALGSKSFNCHDHIPEELLVQYGLVNEMSGEMLKAINNLEFGDALQKLMSKQVCNYSFRLLENTTGLGKLIISNMRRGVNLNKLNVISTCLGVHMPSRVSKKMLELAGITLDVDLPGKEGVEKATYDMLLHLKWATDYDDIIKELASQNLNHLLSEPKSK
ncbi:MAG: type I restriction endonuclease subunit R [Negativicoccus succinicivorans]|uniref:type I restriction endonuclease subunit R n=1 Tax=Negativicoccus succinicivorans TaxID=620903 RepID=UPI0026ECE037|nr:HsdR family type I site-specific deoxyribonuclease [Negativicoccus succinicivorans]MBS5888007.1 type I restriction endonuclease subunit R [Negativicoccus succinicivorans]